MPCCEHSTTGTVVNYNQVAVAFRYVMLNQNKLTAGYIGTSDASKAYLWTVSNG